MRFEEFPGVLALRHFLIGHRGVGKTTVLHALGARGLKTLDLDEELERRYGKNLFERVGEPEYRSLESETLSAVLKDGDAEWIALGAGFSDWAHPAFIQAASRQVIWLERASDTAGRVFLDRPRLEPGLGPIEEFYKRRDERNAAFSRIADLIVELPAFCAGELKLPERLLDSAVPLEPNIALGRRGERIGPSEWPLEEGMPQGEFRILSSHTKGAAELGRVGRDFPDTILKYAPQVESWAELRDGHLWASEEPRRRAFLPCSSDGRWSWYRLWTAQTAPITFLREGLGTAPDQPSIDAWISRRQFGSKHFAAVLGRGVRLSASPDFHQAFFSSWSMPYFAIEVRLGEWSSALPFLTALGLRYASVTSPLKLDAAKEVGATGPVNTLWFEGDRWNGADTDSIGWDWIRTLDLPQPLVLWGARALTSLAVGTPYSARTGLPREPGQPEVHHPATLIWGVPRGVEVREPPASWVPEVVVDLNYTEDSPGREFALRRGVKHYMDGVEFFKTQARAQQKIWAGRGEMK